MGKFIIISACALAFAAASFAAGGKTMWTFDKDRVGTVPPGFARAAGGWRVATDPTAPSQPNVLAQRAKNTDRTLNLIQVAGTTYRNLDLSVKIRVIEGKSWQGGGLAWRGVDAGDYYAVLVNPLDNSIRLYKVANSWPTELVTAELRQVGGWHTLRVVMTEDRVECYYDGRKYLDRRDSTYGKAGTIGLWTRGDAETYFDDLTVQAR
ncbi:MAG: hypothetical protein CXR31_03850 [Geobacter sp.]|nr:MAG: hypothetical protein CXR31_03850 [Geobacter sp.]